MGKERSVVQHSMFGLSPIDVTIEDGSVWLTQKQIAEGFDVSIPTINEHLANIFDSKELEEDSSIRNFRILADDNKMRNAKHYNLDAIISVGYRVNSKTATLFRKEATKVLKEYATKGFALDDERLKSGSIDRTAIEELCARVRSIRTSERNVYKQVTEAVSLCCDYNPDESENRRLFAQMQNKFHYAITGKTAAEIICDAIDSTKENMGLVTFAKSPGGKISAKDIFTAKNYLPAKELVQLEKLVNSFLAILEEEIDENDAPTKKDFTGLVDKHLVYRDKPVLEGHGSVSHEDMKELATREFNRFNKITG